MEEERVIYLSPMDEKKEYALTEKAAAQSRYLRSLMEDLELERIQIPSVEDAMLQKVVAFLNHNLAEPLPDIPKPLVGEWESIVPAWYREFSEQAPAQQVRLVEVANYLDIPKLLELSCAKVALGIRGKTPEEMRKTFGIVNDFTPDEEQKLREETKF